MQSLGDLFANNKVLFVAILVVVLAVVAGAVAFLSRLVFGNRVSTGGGSRTRQPRLGIVDAFDLDRQRQLVIVRRDNVEHLLMIGGPNDLVIETAIVRAAPSAAAVPTREKEIAAGSALPPMPPPISPPPSVPSFAPPTAPSLPSLPVPALADPLGPQAAQNDGGEALPPVAFPPLRPIAEAPPVSAGPITVRPSPSIQEPQRPAPPAPPRQPVAVPAQAGASAPKPVFSPAPPRPTAVPPRPLATPPRAVPPVPSPVRSGEPKRADETPRPTPPNGNTPSDTQPASAMAAEPVSTVKLPAPPVRSPRADAPRIESPPAPKPPTPAPSRPAPVPAPAPVPMVKSLDALESLEEEMAKLLGRPVPPAEKS